MSKRSSDGSIKARSRMSRPSASSDNTGGDGGNGGHEETQLDPIRRGWHIHRGPPDYTHVVLPWVYEQKLEAVEHVRDFTFRMTSPYQPLVTPESTNINIGTGFARAVTSHGTQTKGNFDRTVAYWDYYAGLYNYYSVIGCRYKVRVENLSHEKFYVHSMFVTNTDPPLTASNWDMLIWKGVKSQLVHPYMKFDGGGTNKISNREADQVQMDTDQMHTFDDINPDGDQFPVGNTNRNQFAYVVGEYRPGQADQQIHEDDAVSIWSPITANPTLREALTIRIKPYDNASVPPAGSSASYERDLSYNITVECNYLVEFKELKAGLRWPVTRNPLTVNIASDPRSIGSL